MKNQNNKIENLGQVSTPSNVARLMSYLLLGRKAEGNILDPCVGDNIFFNTINEMYKKNNFNYLGIELDPDVIDKNFYKGKKRKIIIDSFFNIPVNNKFDYIILNPPYIRQEELSVSKFNNKEKITNLFEDYNFKINKRANLYVYFILKAGMHLKQNGKIVIICYDSWLYTTYGKELKGLLKQNFRIDKIIHFKKHVFDKINVGATIIEATKTKQCKGKEKFLYFEIEDKNELPDLNSIYKIEKFIKDQKSKVKNSFNKKSELNIKSQKLGKIFSEIRRGVESPANGIFYKDKKYNLQFYKLIIKNTKSLNRYTVTSQSLLKIFIPSKNISSKKIASEVSKIEKEVNNSKYLALKKKIKSGNENWYLVREVNPGNIIFNYYFRNNIDFIYNPKKYLASNNFYIINSKDVMLDLALLNSSFVRDSIRLESRSQGSGLSKLQLFEFKKVLFPDKSFFSFQDKSILRTLGNQLSKAKRGQEKSIISKIDLVISKINNKANIKK